MKTITINYIFSGRRSHSLTEDWEPLPDLFCPHCGKQEVWHDTGPGDYYANEQFICRSCAHTFTFYGMPSEIHAGEETDSDAQRLRALRE